VSQRSILIARANQLHFYRHPAPTRGAYRDRHGRWARGAMDVKVPQDERHLSGRRSRVVLTPRCWRQVLKKLALLGGDGGNKAGHRGEHVISRKPLRREGRMLPLNLYARVRFFKCIFAHETAGAARTRSSLRPLYFGRNDLQNSGAACREKARLCLEPSTSLRGALATKQSSSPMWPLDCVVAALLAMTFRLFEN
jgi:hypothetical protein